MGLAILKIKIMPESPYTDLDNIEKKVSDIISQENGDRLRFEREPIAFGLVAINALFTREETLDTDSLIERLNTIDQVSSADIIDFRRAVG